MSKVYSKAGINGLSPALMTFTDKTSIYYLHSGIHLRFFFFLKPKLFCSIEVTSTAVLSVDLTEHYEEAGADVFLAQTVDSCSLSCQVSLQNETHRDLACTGIFLSPLHFHI